MFTINSHTENLYGFYPVFLTQIKQQYGILKALNNRK